MQNIVLDNGHVVSVFDDIKSELNIERFNEFQNYLIQDVGIGSTIADVDKHFSRFDMFLKDQKLGDLAKERENLHYNLFAMLNKINHKSMCFGVLISAIDGEVQGYSEHEIKQNIKKLSDWGLTQGEVEKTLESVKKKLMMI